MRLKAFASIGLLASMLALGACGGGSSSSTSTSSSGDVAAFCAKMKQLAAASPFDKVKSGDVQGAKDALAKTRSEVQSIDAVAPAAIKPEADQLTKIFDDAISAVKDANTQEEFVKALQGISSEAAQAQESSTKLALYAHKNCKGL